LRKFLALRCNAEPRIICMTVIAVIYETDSAFRFR
jgi:hypothetical protein